MGANTLKMFKFITTHQVRAPSTQTPGRIQKVDPPILEPNTNLVLGATKQRSKETSACGLCQSFDGVQAVPRSRPSVQAGSSHVGGPKDRGDTRILAIWMVSGLRPKIVDLTTRI